jgi:hypothetical protein
VGLYLEHHSDSHAAHQRHGIRGKLDPEVLSREQADYNSDRPPSAEDLPASLSGTSGCFQEAQVLDLLQNLKQLVGLY